MRSFSAAFTLADAAMVLKTLYHGALRPTVPRRYSFAHAA
jgi:hypothetical protein